MSFLKSKLPAGMPIQVWEAGVFWPDSAGDETVLAGETARLVYLLLADGAQKVIFLPMQSNTASTGEEDRFGLIDANFQPRTGFDVLSRLAEFARQGGGSWQDVSGKDGARAVVGSGTAGAQALLWTDQGSRAGPRPRGDREQPRRLDDRHRPIAPSSPPTRWWARRPTAAALTGLIGA